MSSPFEEVPPEPTRVDRKERLLEAGLELFDEVPFDAMPLEVVAERAGVARGLVAYYFGGKAGLYRSVSERFSWRARSQVQSPTDDVAGWLVADVDAFLDLVQTHPVAWRNLTGSVHGEHGQTAMSNSLVARTMRALQRTERSPLLEAVIASWGMHGVELGLRWLDQQADVDRASVAAVLVAELRGALQAVAQLHPELGLPEHPLT